MKSLVDQLKDIKKTSWDEYTKKTHLYVYRTKFEKGFEKGLKNKAPHTVSFNTSRAYQAGYEAGKFNHELGKSLDNPHGLSIDV